MHYRDYLRLDTLLSLQHPRTSAGHGRVHAAERFFIVAHQSCELWLSQLLLDLDLATDALTPAPCEAELALEHLDRVAGIFRELHSQVATLDRLSSNSFARFRPGLGTASGAQSDQFLELDRSLGVLPTAPAPIMSAFVAAAAARGLTPVDVCRADLDAGVLRRIVDTLLDIGQRYWQWKIAHLSLVSRLLGDIGGTAGTSGADYLARRAVVPFTELRAAQHNADFEAEAA